MYLWLSGADFVSEGEWQWMSSGHNVSYIKWAASEPNNVARGQPLDTENCMELSHAVDYKMNDNSCSHLQNYICEYTP